MRKSRGSIKCIQESAGPVTGPELGKTETSLEAVVLYLMITSRREYDAMGVNSSYKELCIYVCHIKFESSFSLLIRNKNASLIAMKWLWTMDRMLVNFRFLKPCVWNYGLGAMLGVPRS